MNPGSQLSGQEQIWKIKGQLNCIAALMHLQVREKVKLSLEKLVTFFGKFKNPTKLSIASDYDLEKFTEFPALEVKLIPGDQDLPLFNPSIEMIKVCLVFNPRNSKLLFCCNNQMLRAISY